MSFATKSIANKFAISVSEKVSMNDDIFSLIIELFNKYTGNSKLEHEIDDLEELTNSFEGATLKLSDEVHDSASGIEAEEESEIIEEVVDEIDECLEDKLEAVEYGDDEEEVQEEEVEETIKPKKSSKKVFDNKILNKIHTQIKSSENIEIEDIIDAKKQMVIFIRDRKPDNKLRSFIMSNGFKLIQVMKDETVSQISGDSKATKMLSSNDLTQLYSEDSLNDCEIRNKKLLSFDLKCLILICSDIPKDNKEGFLSLLYHASLMKLDIWFIITTKKESKIVFYKKIFKTVPLPVDQEEDETYKSLKLSEAEHNEKMKNSISIIKEIKKAYYENKKTIIFKENVSSVVPKKPKNIVQTKAMKKKALKKQQKTASDLKLPSAPVMLEQFD